MTVGVAARAMLEGMPDPRELRRTEVDGQVLITVGSTAIGDYPVGDAVMRNITAVALTDLGFTGRRVGELLGITEQYVSMLRGRARRHGSAGLAPRRGRPPALGRGDLAQARRLREQGLSDVRIGRRLGVHATTVGRALPARRSTPEAQEPLGEWTLPLEDTPTEDTPTGDTPTGDTPTQEGLAQEGLAQEGLAQEGPVKQAESEDGSGADVVGSARLGEARVDSRYAGAMLLHAFFDRVGAGALFAPLCATGPSRSRRCDDVALLTATSMAFALGVGSVEATKHLVRDQVGPLAGLDRLPELRTLRPRLGELAAAGDPLRLQAELARAMLNAEAPLLGLYFVDEHFVPYEGAKPVGKGYNTKRRHAQKGLADTMITDYHGRAVCFVSGPPSGLTKTLPAALAQLRKVTGDAKIMLGFDRGGSYASVFRHCRDQGVDWVTYRRGTLADTTAEPRRHWRVDAAGRAEHVTLADEIVKLTDYGQARQLTLFEHGQPVLQVLTSDLHAPAAALLAWLRCRWRIENVFKYLTAHYGMDWLCHYDADLAPDTALIDNPARKTARATLKRAETTLAAAQQAFAELCHAQQSVTAINAEIPAAEEKIDNARAAVAAARENLKTIPAKIPANQHDPNAQRAFLRTQHRSLQMVLRLLAFNAEQWLATRLNAYLADNDEYRATLRHLLHLGGRITYTPKAITVALDTPTTPKITRALRLLLEELNTTPPRIPGDHRPITYTIKTA